MQPPTEGVILQTFGAGNMPSQRTDIIAEIKEAVDRGCIVVNCTQCLRGQVDVNYFTGKVSFRYCFILLRSVGMRFIISRSVETILVH